MGSYSFRAAYRRAPNTIRSGCTRMYIFVVPLRYRFIFYGEVQRYFDHAVRVLKQWRKTHLGLVLELGRFKPRAYLLSAEWCLDSVVHFKCVLGGQLVRREQRTRNAEMATNL